MKYFLSYCLLLTVFGAACVSKEGVPKEFYTQILVFGNASSAFYAAVQAAKSNAEVIWLSEESKNTFPTDNKNIKILDNHQLISTIVDGNILRGAVFLSGKDTIKIFSKMSIDASECGKLIELSGADFTVEKDSVSCERTKITANFIHNLQDLSKIRQSVFSANYLIQKNDSVQIKMPFILPYEVFFSPKIQGLLAAEKNISINKTVLLENESDFLEKIGMAAGALATLCVEQNIYPKQLEIRQLQQMMLNSKIPLFEYANISINDWAFESVQKSFVSGILKPDPFFGADSSIFAKEMLEILTLSSNKNISANLQKIATEKQTQVINRYQAIHFLWQQLDSPKAELNHLVYEDFVTAQKPVLMYFQEQNWTKNWAEGNLFEGAKPIKRKELLFLIETSLSPFVNKEN
ncbi:MAG: FAD-dependent oxidoreductase [Bacteroidetes bacterium]|nr:MAG: FAD-dependent oxidoreductase [Bacteroidota bacterium]